MFVDTSKRPRSNRDDRRYNSLSKDDLKMCFNHLCTKGHLVKDSHDLWRCTLKPAGKYPQFAIPTDWHSIYRRMGLESSSGQAKLCVHIVLWRYFNDGKELTEGKEISHCHADSLLQYLTEETPELNESRKHCSREGWCHTRRSTGYCKHDVKCPHDPPCRCNKCPDYLWARCAGAASCA